MRIKIIGNNDCARATRHLLRQAGFAVTEFLPANAVTHGPQAGYVITIDLVPQDVTPHDGTPQDGISMDSLSPATPPDSPSPMPDSPTHHQTSTRSGEVSAVAAFQAKADASSPTSTHSVRARHAVPLHVIHFDSVDSPLEAAIMRHVTQLSPAPVVVDRPGGVVHSERELRIVVPSGDESATVAVEFGVLRGLLDLMDAGSPSASTLRGELRRTDSPSPEGDAGRKKWWHFFPVLLLATSVLFAGDVRANPKHAVEARGEDGAFLHLEAALIPAQAQFASGQMNLALIGGSVVSSSLYDSGNTALKVNCVVGCSASAGFTDNSAFTAGTTAEANIGGVFNDGLSALSSGNAASARITASRALHVNLRNASGTEIGTASNAVRIDPTGSTTQPVSWSGQSVSLTGTLPAFASTPTVTANAGTNLNTSALALDTSVNGILNSQASATAGQKGPLAQCAVTTNAASGLTSGDTYPFSCDTSQILRVSLKDTPANTSNLNVNLAASAINVQPTPQSTSTYAASAFDLAATAATQVKASGGNVWGWYGFNPNASTCYLQFYNSTSATLGTSVLHPFGVAAGASFNMAPGSIALFNLGTGISTGETTTATGSSQCGSAMLVTILYN